MAFTASRVPAVRRVDDVDVLHLLKIMPKANGKQGVPQGGVISPLLSNVTARITLRIEDAVVVPTAAVQVSQTGTYVYVVENELAVMRQVEVSRSTADEMVIRSGLSGGETVITGGHLLLSDRTPVKIADR
jgi:multidrug efflux pump subunit AcrA (membrane-fusion protein)